MSKSLQSEELARDNQRRILAYMRHLEKTAQQADDKRLFKAFVQQAKRRIEENGSFPISAAEHAIGSGQTQPISEMASSPAPLKRSRARIKRMDAMW